MKTGVMFALLAVISCPALPRHASAAESRKVCRLDSAVVFESAKAPDCGHLVLDPATRLYASGGFDGTLVVLDQVKSNTCELFEATTSRPYARTTSLDQISKIDYTVTAGGLVDVARRCKTNITPCHPDRYFLNTVKLLTHSQH